MLISGWQQALTVLAIVIPGFVYQGVRSRLRGPTPGEQDLGLRLIRSLAASGMFALAYVAALGSSFTNRARTPVHALDSPRVTALILLALVFVVPAATAGALHFREVSRLYPGEPFLSRFKVYNPLCGPSSFYSSYPESREIFVEQAWELDQDGVFVAPVDGTNGAWIKCDESPVVAISCG